jgi:hypothetical protein
MDITDNETCVEKNVINMQQPHWEKVFEKNCSMFGDNPSYPARKRQLFSRKKHRKRTNGSEG